MDYLPFYLGGFGILVLSLIGWVYLQNHRLKQKLIHRLEHGLETGSSPSELLHQLVHEGIQPPDARQLLELAHQRSHYRAALDLIQQGKTEEELSAQMTDRGIPPEKVEAALGSAQFTHFCQTHPVLSMTLGVVLPLAGLALMVGGLALWFGNKSGWFVTFPFAGHFVMGIGFVVILGGGAFLVRTLRQ